MSQSTAMKIEAKVHNTAQEKSIGSLTSAVANIKPNDTPMSITFTMSDLFFILMNIKGLQRQKGHIP